MSLDLIHLRKALKFCMLDEDRARSALRREAYEDRRRIENSGEGGGDYFGPFWSDAKTYAYHAVDLVSATEARIESNDRRCRLYPILCNQFVGWWRQFGGTMNEPLAPLHESVHARFDFEELGMTLKVDNLLAFQIDRERHRLIYPYFSEQPVLSPYWARVGLWVMHRALDKFRIEDMVILDVQRGRSFSTREVNLQGNEEEIFVRRISHLRMLWENILDEAA